MILNHLALPFCAVLGLLPPLELAPELLGGFAGGMVRIEVGVGVPEDDKLAMSPLQVCDFGIRGQAMRAVTRKSIVLKGASALRQDRSTLQLSLRRPSGAMRLSHLEHLDELGRLLVLVRAKWQLL